MEILHCIYLFYIPACTGKYWGPRCETKCPNNCGGNSCRKENGDCICEY